MSDIVKFPVPSLPATVPQSSGDLPTRLCAAWTPDQPVIAEQAEALPEALRQARAALVKIDPHELASVLAKTVLLYDRQLPAAWADVAEFYLEALSDLPRDLVIAALRHVRLTLKFFPQPAEIRGSVVLDLDRRRHVLRRLECMEQKLKLGAADLLKPLRVAPTPADIAAVEEINRGLRQALATAEKQPRTTGMRRVMMPVKGGAEPCPGAEGST